MTLLLHLATLKVDKIHLIRHDDQITKRLFRSRMDHIFDATCSRVARMTSQPHESTVFYKAKLPSGSPHPIFYSIFRGQTTDFRGVSWPSWTPSSGKLWLAMLTFAKGAQLGLPRGSRRPD